MTNLETKRDELADEFSKSVKFMMASDVYKAGFDASTAEWQKIVEPLLEALNKSWPGEYGMIIQQHNNEALEQYRKVMG